MPLFYHGTSAGLFGTFLPTSGRFTVHTKLCARPNARHARLYGLTRDKFRYILDPKEATGDPDFPSESFRDLQYHELASFGEYCTCSLILEAWDKWHD